MEGEDELGRQLLLRPFNRDQPSGAYVRHFSFVKYCNRLIRPIDILTWLSGLAPHLMELFGQAHQGSKTDRLTLNLVYWSSQTHPLCKSSFVVFGPYLLGSL